METAGNTVSETDPIAVGRASKLDEARPVASEVEVTVGDAAG